MSETAMDYQQKSAALAALSELAIVFREAEWRIGRRDAWYIQQRVVIKDGPILSSAFGNGATPEEAINDHWRQLVDELPPDQYLVLDAGGSARRAVRWNGFMWANVTEPEKAA